MERLLFLRVFCNFAAYPMLGGLLICIMFVVFPLCGLVVALCS